MRRSARIVGIVVGAAVAANVLVAACAMLVQSTARIDALLTAEVRMQRWEDDGASGAPPDDDAWIVGAYRGGAYSVVIEHRGTAPRRVIRWYAAGWPWRSFAGSSEGGAVRLGPKVTLDARPTLPPPGTAAARAPRPTTEEVDAVFPVVPLWSGLILNTLLYAGAILALAALRVGTRGVLRRWRRRCPRCGYSLAGAGTGASASASASTAGCPECGHGRGASAAQHRAHRARVEADQRQR